MVRKMIRLKRSFSLLDSRLPANLIIALITICLVSCFSAREDRSRLAEVERLWSTFPLYEGMVEVDTSRQSGFGKAHVSKTFQCKAPYETVKAFYIDKLGSRGWKITEEKELKNWQGRVIGRLLTLSRDHYEITIENDEVASDADANYGVGIGWALTLPPNSPPAQKER
jgi:hypothetical protein